MGCGSCSNNTTQTGLPKGCKNNGTCGTDGCNKLNSYDWLANIQFSEEPRIPEVVEVKFKGTRKGFYKNFNNFDLEIGDFVVVDSHTGGYDIGYVSLRSELVYHQMRKYGVEADNPQMLSIRKRANEEEMENYRKARRLEDENLYTARTIAMDLGLEMKLSDIEYQADLSKATFYYTAEGRVDFRELIKKLASTFNVKVEMKQIGLRQEAGRLGGIGSCGRELCCSTWLTDFESVPTVAARYQNLFINPTKLAGQCGRLKCCLNYELDTYLEALEAFPDEHSTIETVNGPAKIIKTDILKGMVWLSYKQKSEEAKSDVAVPFDVQKVNSFLQKNQNGEKIDALEDFSEAGSSATSIEAVSFKDVVGEADISRFDDQDKKEKGGGRKKQGGRGRKKGGGAPSGRQKETSEKPKTGQAKKAPEKQGESKGLGNKPNKREARKKKGPPPKKRGRNKDDGNSGQNQNNS